MMKRNNGNVSNDTNLIDVNNDEYALLKSKLPEGVKPIRMEKVEEYLRGQGAIDTNEFLQRINE